LMYGSLSFAGRSWDGGEAKAAQVGEMRQTEEFLRGQLTSEFPLRARKIVELPLQFTGDHDELRYAAALPSRVVEGGVYFFRVAVVREGDKSLLVQERMIPDLDATQEQEFRDPDRSVLAEGISELKIQYLGRDPNTTDADTNAPTWRDKWEDKQRLPILLRIDVTPEKGPAWPTLVIEPRQAPEAGCRVYDPNRARCVGM
jgi:general secretion pathway protein J